MTRSVILVDRARPVGLRDASCAARWPSTRPSTPTLPSHQTLLNHIARAAGHRNLQALQARIETQRIGATGGRRRTTDAPVALTAAARKALALVRRHGGRVSRWPHKHSVQRLALWVMWMQFEIRRVYTEREVNAVLKAWHTWGDHVTLRRELINDHLLTRKSDGSQYRKLPARPERRGAIADDRLARAARRCRARARCRPGLATRTRPASARYALSQCAR